VALADVVRPESREAVARLKKLGIRCLMLTGDNRRVAAWVGEQIGLDEVFAEVLPQDKAAKVREVQARGLTVAMTGDGVNDAPGPDPGGRGHRRGAGTEVAIQSADIVLVRSNPLDVASILASPGHLSQDAAEPVLGHPDTTSWPFPWPPARSTGWAFSFPRAGGVFMSLSTIIVAINARFLRVKAEVRLSGFAAGAGSAHPVCTAARRAARPVMRSTDRGGYRAFAARRSCPYRRAKVRWFPRRQTMALLGRG